MRGDRDDASAPRTPGLVAGSVLAVVATVVVLRTDDPRVLRLAVVAAAWAFVLAALVAPRRSAGSSVDERAALDRAGSERPAAEREATEREAELRRAAEQSTRAALSMRAELSALRAELSALRAELSSVGELRREMAQVVELRRDIGRLRSELTQQLSGEMLVERVVLRTPSTRTAPDPAAPRTVEAESWAPSAPEPIAVHPAGRPLLDPPPPPYAHAGPRRRRTDAPAPAATSVRDELLTAERPVAQRVRPPVPAPPAAAPTAEAPFPAEEDAASRLAQLLAEGGLTPPSSGRRRRRYREDGETDDVLARVLGRT